MMLSDAKSEEDMWGSARKVNNLCHKKEVSPPTHMITLSLFHDDDVVCEALAPERGMLQ